MLMLVTAAASPAAQAGFGVYLPGLGAQSSGAGGIVYCVAQDTTPLSSNPALAREIGDRFDLTLALLQTRANVHVHDNPLAPDQKTTVVDNEYVFPYAGFTRRINDSLSMGMTGFVAGFGSVYDDSPYRRFGGDEKVSVTLFQLGVSTILAYEIVPQQSIGLSVNLSYDALKLKGMGSTLASFSETPHHFTDQGMDGIVGYGMTIGWYGQLTPWLAGGAGYRSKTYSNSKIDAYEGLLPNQGMLQFPASWGGGLALTPNRRWTVALEAQHYDYDGAPTFHNPLSRIEQHRFGSDNGPGFGWRSQNVVRIGVIYKPIDAVTLRAGHARGTQQMRRSSTLLAALAPGTTQKYYSFGATWLRKGGWEWTLSLGYEPTGRVRGKDSLPAMVGGGEVDIENSYPSILLSLARRFDAQ
jgi:long-chain fatty acid transport protein